MRPVRRTMCGGRGWPAFGLVIGAALVFSCKDPPKEQAPSPEAAAPVEAAAPAPVQNNNPYTTAQIQKLVNPSGLPPYSGATGSVEGTITVRGGEPGRAEADFSRCPDAAATYGTKYRIGPANAEGHALADAIVAVTGYDAYVPAKTDYVTVAFEGCAYDRRTVLLTFGQRIDVLNRAKKQMITPDIEGLPVLSLRIAAPGSIAPVKLYPPQVGRFKLIDRGVLKYVAEDVYVLMHPLHSTTDLKGYYRIDGIPVGRATVNGAHPAFAGDAAKEITISANIVARVDLVLTPGGEADAGANAKDAGANANANAKDAGGPTKPTIAPIR